jgi:hypothetical protein
VNGAKAYFDMINDAGGVDGRKRRLLAYDDSYDPAKTQICFDRLMEQKVFALGFFVGTPTAVKYLPMAENSKIPLVRLFTGAQTLYTPLRHWAINVRASYFDETREQIEGMWGTLVQENRGNLSRGCVWNGSPRGSKGGTESSRCRASWRSLLSTTDRAGRRSD